MPGSGVARAVISWSVLVVSITAVSFTMGLQGEMIFHLADSLGAIPGRASVMTKRPRTILERLAPWTAIGVIALVLGLVYDHVVNLSGSGPNGDGNLDPGEAGSIRTAAALAACLVGIFAWSLFVAGRRGRTSRPLPIHNCLAAGSAFGLAAMAFCSGAGFAGNPAFPGLKLAAALAAFPVGALIWRLLVAGRHDRGLPWARGLLSGAIVGVMSQPVVLVLAPMIDRENAKLWYMLIGFRTLFVFGQYTITLGAIVGLTLSMLLRFVHFRPPGGEKEPVPRPEDGLD